MRQRGRPRSESNAKTAEADAIIGRTAETLIVWGYPARQVYRAICRPANDVLGRTCERSAIGHKRVEQIHAAWRARQGEWAFPRHRFTKHSLQNRRPDNSGPYLGLGASAALERLAGSLIKNRGSWPHERVVAQFAYPGAIGLDDMTLIDLDDLVPAEPPDLTRKAAEQNDAQGTPRLVLPRKMS